MHVTCSQFSGDEGGVGETESLGTAASNGLIV
jgi:hypothetical protein